MDVTVRQATLADEDAVVAFARETWPDRGGDYLPSVFADWVRADGDRRRTFVAEIDGETVGVVRAVLLTADEAWFQGMRVAPHVRGRGLSGRLNDAAAQWARSRGATVGRIMVFSSNAGGLAAARAAGFEPVTAIRWVHPAPDREADPALATTGDVDAAWDAWTTSAGRTHLGGLALSPEESWALRRLRPETLERAAATTRLVAVDAADAAGFAFRVRDYERDSGNGDPERWAVYGVAAWSDATAGAAVLADIARDAAAVGADRTRVLLPDTARAISDAALAGAGLAGEPDIVLALALDDTV